MSDGTLTDTGTVTLTVTAVNDAPVAGADTASTAEDTPVVIDVLANDSDVEGGSLSVTGASAANVSLDQMDAAVRIGRLTEIRNGNEDL